MNLNKVENKNKPIFGVLRLDKNAIMPTVAYEGTSACFDLCATESTKIPAHGSAMVPNGLKITIPQGYYLEFANRSGNGIKKNLRIHPGIIDNGYLGPLEIKVFNLGDEDQVIEKGKGICQVKVMKIPEYELVEITEEDWNKYSEESIRGENGIGSTDKK